MKRKLMKLKENNHLQNFPLLLMNLRNLGLQNTQKKALEIQVPKKGQRVVLIRIAHPRKKDKVEAGLTILEAQKIQNAPMEM